MSHLINPFEVKESNTLLACSYCWGKASTQAHYNLRDKNVKLTCSCGRSSFVRVDMLQNKHNMTLSQRKCVIVEAITMSLMSVASDEKDKKKESYIRLAQFLVNSLKRLRDEPLAVLSNYVYSEAIKKMQGLDSAVSVIHVCYRLAYTFQDDLRQRHGNKFMELVTRWKNKVVSVSDTAIEDNSLLFADELASLINIELSKLVYGSHNVSSDIDMKSLFITREPFCVFKVKHIKENGIYILTDKENNIYEAHQSELVDENNNKRSVLLKTPKRINKTKRDGE